MSPTLDQLIDDAAATVARLNAICEHAEGIIATLQQSMPEPREEAPPLPEKLAGELCGFRYFKSDINVWKMPPSGQGFVRWIGGSQWSGSMCRLEDMDCVSEKEITALEGEL